MRESRSEREICVWCEGGWIGGEKYNVGDLQRSNFLNLGGVSLYYSIL